MEINIARTVVITLGALFSICPTALAGTAPNGHLSADVGISRILPSDYADPELREVDWITAYGQRLAAICASPSHPASSTGKPPYAKVFIASFQASRWRVTASAECAGDVMVESIVALPDGKCGIVLGAVTRQYGGSIAMHRLRVYLYDARSGRLRRQITIRYVDGGMALMPSRTGRSPAFLVAEPLYDVSKLEPQRIRFRLYTPSSPKGYSLGLTMVSRRRYDRLEDAYGEVRPRLQKALGSSYSIPLRSSLSQGGPAKARRVHNMVQWDIITVER